MALLGQSSFVHASVDLSARNLMTPSLPIKLYSCYQKPASFLSDPTNKNSMFVTLASLAPFPTSTSKSTETPTQSRISESTHSLKMLLSLALSASIWLQKLAQRIPPRISVNPGLQQLDAIRSLRGNLVCSTGPLFFAAMRSKRVNLNTPLTVIAAGLSKWLEIYGSLIMIRVLLSWFPSIPWDRQPLSAIRDLCDPFLHLCRNIIPPLFGTLDVSPLLAFLLLGTLATVLRSSATL